MEFSKLISGVRDLFETTEFIPLHEPRFVGNERSYVTNAIDSTFVSSVGAYVNRIEEQLADYTKTAKATAVVNGTAALQVSLRIAGVKEEEEVLTQALTFVATANAISYNGASPVFIDVDLDTMGMSAKALELWLSEFGENREQGTFNKKTNKRIAACMPMHTFGFMCRISEVITICEKWGIPVVEDAAEALGSVYKNKPAGSWGIMGALSFNGNKLITAGGGGCIVSSERKWAERAKFLTTTAKRPHSYEYVHEEVGYNFRMPNLNAALLSAQIEQLDSFIEIKKRLYSDYIQCLEGTGLQLMPVPENQTWNYWLFSILSNSEKERSELLEATNRAGIMTRPIWRLIYKLPMYSHCQRDGQSNAEFLEQRIVNVPSSVRINK